MLSGVCRQSRKDYQAHKVLTPRRVSNKTKRVAAVAAEVLTITRAPRYEADEVAGEEANQRVRNLVFNLLTLKE